MRKSGKIIILCRKVQKQRRSQVFTPNSFHLSVGVTGFEPATTRPPDVYSNRAELHPVCFRVQK